MKVAGPPTAVRRQLRTLRGVELWHIEEPKARGSVPDIHYLVIGAGIERTFARPHEAWSYFQKLAGVPNRGIRPEPRLEEAIRGRSKRPRKPARGRKPKDRS